MWMQTALLIVFGLFSLDVLVGLILALVKKSFSITKLPSFLTSDILKLLFPLTLLGQFTNLDPTHIVLPVLFFIAALGLAVKYLSDIYAKFTS